MLDYEEKEKEEKSLKKQLKELEEVPIDQLNFENKLIKPANHTIRCLDQIIENRMKHVEKLEKKLRNKMKCKELQDLLMEQPFKSIIDMFLEIKNELYEEISCYDWQKAYSDVAKKRLENLVKNLVKRTWSLSKKRIEIERDIVRIKEDKERTKEQEDLLTKYFDKEEQYRQKEMERYRKQLRMARKNNANKSFVTAVKRLRREVDKIKRKVLEKEREREKSPKKEREESEQKGEKRKIKTKKDIIEDLLKTTNLSNKEIAKKADTTVGYVRKVKCLLP